MSYFKPMPPKLGGCWTCTHWHGETTDQGRRPYCRRDPQYKIAATYPDEGCGSWLREIGSDDEIKLSKERGPDGAAPR
ncbi:hypothetical protein HMPREF0004_4565 [Achromobacter piechaudii ATCC 43553]|uniref:Uncharacterized protein n=1 Tax=Achromobacter piechaudii ATCC 43553 TaxID=742159 RepID=D4XGG8_9BURK|nr:hypothetical protein HMPREF0004_4565 [Achromobacter piechaudii ATCC 43553]